MLNSIVVPMGIPGLPDAEDFVHAFLGALQNIFGGSAQKAIHGALQDLADNIPTLDLHSATFERYDGMFALAIACGLTASAFQLIRVVRLGTWESLFDAVKPVPIIVMIAAPLPYTTSMVAGAIGDLHRGIVSFVLDKPLDKNTFDFTLAPDFGFFSTLFGWIGGKLLNLESDLLIALLPQTLLVLVLAIGLRWFGFMGDGLFVLCMGITITALVGSTAMVFVLSLFFMVPANILGSGYVAVAVFITSLVPLIVFWLYFYFGINKKVSGLMEMRQVNTAISARTRGDATSGGLAGKVAIAGAGALAGSMYNRANGNSSRPEDTTRTEHIRQQMHGRLNTAAGATAAANPVASAALLMGAQFIKPRPKKMPPPPPTGQNIP